MDDIKQPPETSEPEPLDPLIANHRRQKEILKAGGEIRIGDAIDPTPEPTA